MTAVKRLARDPNLTRAILEAESDLPASWQRIDRRGFLKLTGLAGAGLTLAAYFGRDASALPAMGGAGPFEPNAFVNIAPDGTITLVAKNPEIGQGIKTAFSMILAEELDASWEDVKVVQSAIDADVFGRQAAGGSRSIPSSWDMLRQAGAAARAMLVAAAAQTWGVPETEITTGNSVATHSATGRTLSYGELAEMAAGMPVPDASSLRLKSRDEYTLLGRRIPGVDNEAIVRGEPLFGIDQVLPGMVYATYVKCPATGGKVRSANLDEIKALPGIRDAFVLEGNDTVSELMPGVAIVGDSTWATFAARDKLQVDWDESEASRDSTSAMAAEAQRLAGQSGAQVAINTGDVASAFADAARTLEAFYSYPFLPHAPLEPQNCTAHYADGKIEIWAPSQAPQRGISNVARVLEIAEENILVHQTRVGGGFGRRLVNDFMCEVAAIAQRVGVPVKLQWTREDDMRHDFYRPLGFHSLKGALDADGRLVAWRNHVISVNGGGMRAGVHPENLIEHYRVEQTTLPSGTPTGAWRAPGSNAFGFVVGSFLDELSSAAGRDHLEFLLELMGEPRWIQPGNEGALNTGRAAGVIRLAAEKAGWGKALPEGRGMGLSFYFCHAGHVAEVAEVSVDADRKLIVHRVTVAVDIGPIVNLSGAEAQCQGAVVDALSTMMGLEIAFENGQAQQTNFGQYPVLPIGKAPVVDVHFIQSDYPPTGLGEPTFPPLAAAVGNAIFAATGHRVRALPLSNEGYSI